MSGAGKSGNPAKSGRAAASSGVAESAGGRARPAGGDRASTPGTSPCWPGCSCSARSSARPGRWSRAAGSPAGCCSRCSARRGAVLGGAQADRHPAGRRRAGRGLAVAVILLTATRPEGDFLFAAGIGSYSFLLGGMAVAVICATLVRRGTHRRPAARLGEVT